MLKFSRRFAGLRRFSSSTGPTPLLVKGGTVVNAENQFKADVLLEGGKISQVITNSAQVTLPQNVKTIDATGKYVMPGGIDPHCHLEMPFMGTTSIDDFYQGTKAAVAGGTTTFFDFIIPGEEGLMAAYEDWRKRADAKVNIDYSLHCAITNWNEQVSKEMEQIVKEGVQSFKVFMAYKGTSLYQSDERLLQIFSRCKELGALVMVHAENADLITFNTQRLIEKGVTGPEGHLFARDGEVEAQAVHTAISIANALNTPVYIVHLMKKIAAQEMRRAKKKGYLVFGEALTAGLGTDGQNYFNKDWDHAAGYIMSPVIDDNPQTKDFLMQLLATHDIDTVATDNCTFAKHQKRMGHECFNKIPNGTNGIEDRMSVTWSRGVESGVLTPSDFVRVTSTNQAKIFNLYPHKGVIQAGADADVVVWDPEKTRTISAHTHHHAVDFNIFEGMKVKGSAATTIQAGKVLWDGKTVTDNKGNGRYLRRSTHGFSFERVPIREKQRDIRQAPIDRSQKDDQKTLEQQNKGLQVDLDIALEKIKKLEYQLASQGTQQATSQGNNSDPTFDSKHNELISVETVLNKYVPERERKEVKRIWYGNEASKLNLPQKAHDIANRLDFALEGYKIHAAEEQIRRPRIVRIGAIQNSIRLPTTAPVNEQRDALNEWLCEVAHAAHLAGVNILAVQEFFPAPFFVCTREKYPWVELGEDYLTGPSAQVTKELAKKYNMVIANSILERDSTKGTLHNCSVLTSNSGVIQGRHHKTHIPRVGDFNESTYYMEGNLGHDVYETDFGNIGINVCYGRHHPLNWLMYKLNGAEIVINPSATVGGLSEPMWPIEARNAAIANSYYTVAINRVGTEVYEHPFTSGDGKGPKHEFGMFYGSSYVAAPDGSRTPGLPRTRDGLLVTEIDLNLCTQIMDKWGFQMTNRLELYAEQYTKATKPDFKPQRVPRV